MYPSMYICLSFMYYLQLEILICVNKLVQIVYIYISIDKTD